MCIRDRSKENKCYISFSHGIYRNRFTFLFGDKSNKIDEVTITQHTLSVKINISRSVDRESHNMPFSLTCREVINTILACSSDIRQWLPSTEISTALTCDKCLSKDHFIVIPPGATTRSRLRCQGGKICTLSPAQQHWLTVSSKEEVYSITSHKLLLPRLCTSTTQSSLPTHFVTIHRDLIQQQYLLQLSFRQWLMKFNVKKAN